MSNSALLLGQSVQYKPEFGGVQVSASIWYAAPLEFSFHENISNGAENTQYAWHLLQHLATFNAKKRKRSLTSIVKQDDGADAAVAAWKPVCVYSYSETNGTASSEWIQEPETKSALESRFHHHDSLYRKNGKRCMPVDPSSNVNRLLSDAFELAAAKVLGHEAHGLTLIVHGTWDSREHVAVSTGANAKQMYIAYKAQPVRLSSTAVGVHSKTDSQLVDLPLGAASVRVPTEPPPPEVAQSIHKVVCALGLRLTDGPAWRFLSHVIAYKKEKKEEE